MMIYRPSLISTIRNNVGLFQQQLLSSSNAHSPPSRGILKSASVEIASGNYIDYLLENGREHENETALIDAPSGKRFNYRQVLEARSSLASALYKLGAKKGSVTALVSPNYPEFVLSQLGVITTGSILSCQNPLSTTEELMNMWKDINPNIVITHSLIANKIKQAAESTKSVKHIVVIGETVDKCIHFDSLLENKDRWDASRSGISEWKNEIGALPFTSGTTGLPKGVMITHHNMICNLAGMIYALRETPPGTERFMGLLPLYHIYGFGVSVGLALRTANTLVTMPKFDPETFLEHVCKYKMTTLHMVPPLIHFILHNPKLKQYDLSNVSVMTSGAASIDRNTELLLKEKIHDINPNIDFYQGYGLTEITIALSVPEVKRRQPNKEGSVGKLLPNLEAKVVSHDSGEEMGPGQVGELLIRGDGVMTGYFKREDETKKVFNDGFFCTGDLVYYDDDGYFYIVDRLKELIKYKANQVPPAELEGILRNHAEILDCAVVGKPDLIVGELPTAFVVVKPGSGITEKEIQNYVSERVSEFKKLRGGVIFCQSIPKSPSGKILRRNLVEILKTKK